LKLREVFLKEIAVLNSADAALAWACQSLAAKNTLTVEDAFGRRRGISKSNQSVGTRVALIWTGAA
jgi:hypothetical protein